MQILLDVSLLKTCVGFRIFPYAAPAAMFFSAALY